MTKFIIYQPTIAYLVWFSSILIGAQSANAQCDTRNLVGWQIVYSGTVTGYIDEDGTKSDDFEGCEFGRRLILDNGLVVECIGYNYSYSFLPDITVYSNGIGSEACIDDQFYSIIFPDLLKNSKNPNRSKFSLDGAASKISTNGQLIGYSIYGDGKEICKDPFASIEFRGPESYIFCHSESTSPGIPVTANTDGWLYGYIVQVEGVEICRDPMVWNLGGGGQIICP